MICCLWYVEGLFWLKFRHQILVCFIARPAAK